MPRLVLQQFGVGAGLDDLTVIHDQDAAGVANRRQSVRDDDDRASLTDRLHVVLDGAFRFVIQRTGRLVEDENAWLTHQSAGDGDTLALTAGERRPVFTYDGVVSFRQFEDEFVRAGEPGGGDHLLQRCARIGQRDVLPQAAVEQYVLLQHHADLTTQAGGIGEREIQPIDEHPTAFRHIQALDQLGERALARARTADDADDLTGLDVQGDALEHFQGIGPIPKVDIVERDATRDGRQAAPGGGGFGGRVEDVAQALDGNAGLLEIGPQLRQPHDGLRHAAGQHIEGDELADTQLSLDDQPGTQP